MLTQKHLVLEVGTELENLRKIVCVSVRVFVWVGVDPVNVPDNVTILFLIKNV